MNLALEWILTHRWAMLPAVLQALAFLAKAESAKEHDGQAQDELAAAQGAVESSRMCIALKNGSPIDGTVTAELHGSVAVIPVVGVIYSGRYSYWGGGTSIQILAKDIATSVADPSVSSIVLNINTPGGDVTGISEVAQVIHDARKSKPVHAYVYGLGASAGYWLASAAKSIVAADTAEVGSIGVASVFMDWSEYDKKLGLKEIEVVSSQSPLKRLTPASDKGKALLQTKVDDLADIFISAVAKYRGATVETVLSDFGQGDIMVASKAKAAGMIDAIGSLESMINDLNNKTPKLSMGGLMDLKELQAKHPEVYQAAIDLGKNEAATGTQSAVDQAAKAASEKERQRIAGILTLSKHPGADKVIQVALVDPNATKESVAIQILEGQQQTTQTIATAVAADSSDLASQISQVEQAAPQASEASQEIELGKAIAAAAGKVE